MSKPDETVLAKLRKLLAMAHDGRGNETEAETALRHAEALMRKHGIEAGGLNMSDATVIIHNRDNIGDDVDAGHLLRETLIKAVFQQDATQADIYVNKREASGFIEFLLVIRRKDVGNKLTIGCIQRSLGQKFEFHS